MSEGLKVYSIKEVSSIMSIGESTIRKWCVHLECKGYRFNKGRKGNRILNECDLSTLIHFKYLIKTKMKTKEEASALAVERYNSIKSEKCDSLEGWDLIKVEEVINAVRSLKEEQKRTNEKLDLLIQSLLKDK